MTTDAEIEAKRQELLAQLVREDWVEALTEADKTLRDGLGALLVAILCRDPESPARAEQNERQLARSIGTAVLTYFESAVEEDLAEWIAKGPEREALAADERRFEQRREG